jgi:acyl-CoA thioester hydrolase
VAARYQYDCALRWSDLDSFGHVNNASIVTLYEEARVALMFTDARRVGISTLAEGCVIARHEIDYLRPVGNRGSVRIEMWVEELRPSRIVVCYELFDDGVVASRARTVCVPFDLSGGRPRRLTDAEREFLSPWLG